MKRKYIIHDEDGKEFEVEEMTEKEEVTPDKTKDEGEGGGLTESEIEALKKLAGVADKLIGLISEDVGDTDEDIDEKEVDKDETVIDTDEEEDKRRSCDSKASFNSIEKKKIKSNDSIDNSDEINAAWAKRYNRG